MKRAKRKKSVEVVEFVDPYIKRRKARPIKAKSPLSVNKTSRQEFEDSLKSINKTVLLEEVVLSLEETEENKELINSAKVEKAKRLGTYRPQKEYVNYKELQKQIKERKKFENELLQRKHESTSVASSLVRKRRKQESRMSRYQKEKKFRRRNTTTNKVDGDLFSYQGKGTFKDGILHLNSAFE